MRKSDFFFDLPSELVAQEPLDKRDHSRLLRLDRNTGAVSHSYFYCLPEILRAGDLLVMNDSRVIPARLLGRKFPSGGAVEFLLLDQRSACTWEILAKPGKKASPGAYFSFGEGRIRAEILEVLDDGKRLAKFEYEGDFFKLLDKIGLTPLPHYITVELEDPERYQTVYSKYRGSAAAPTAGLHFTPGLLERLHKKGIDTAFITLHVGVGTFRPVKTDEITRHKMHSERYSLPEETAKKINDAKKTGGRVIAVGTTSCRTLESVSAARGEIAAHSGETSIFIYPGYKFKALDGLITNFHLPESTLIMLVSAFAGYESAMNAYRIAINERYRFYSLGDSMFII